MNVRKQFGSPLPDSLQLTIGDANPDVAGELASAFADVSAVRVVEGNLLDLGSDAVVSPANSFGDMGGGIDKAIDDHHRGEAQTAVVDEIRRRFFGELPVGTAIVTEVPGGRKPAIVVAPTMRIPGNVARSLNAYLAMRAALVAVIQYNIAADRPIRSLAVPGMCTGVGRMPYARAARQMRGAYDNVLGGGWRTVVHSAMAPFASDACEFEWTSTR